ncbi:MAG: efflux RND transporter periplasmic adaptor subunit [Acidobacteriia bacterium]|nr:efflux RND transporter periplasmic adaptor subunit [Terriglobia bacterium]
MSSPSVRKFDTLDTLRIARRPERKRGRGKSRGILGLLLIGILVLASSAYVLYLRALVRRATVETFMVTTQQGSQSATLLTGTGYVVTRHKYIIVGTKILGQIVEEPIEEGQRVKKGDLLARIDDRDYQAQLRQAVANRDLAYANLRLMAAKAQRQRELYTAGIISKDDFDISENALAVAQSSLRRDEAAIDYAKFEVNQCVIISPIDGVILQKYRELGDTINYGGQVQAGGGATDIAQLADTADMRAEVDINESDISKLSMGMPALVVPDAYPDARFDATLVKIYPAADRQKATVRVEVQIRQPNLAVIKPEMSVKANFLEKRAVLKDRPRIFIPKKAILREGNDAFVWIVRDGTAKRVSILRGSETEREVEVQKGLKNGDVVVTSPGANLGEGQKVQVMAR